MPRVRGIRYTSWSLGFWVSPASETGYSQVPFSGSWNSTRRTHTNSANVHFSCQSQSKVAVLTNRCGNSNSYLTSWQRVGSRFSPYTKSQGGLSAIKCIVQSTAYNVPMEDKLQVYVCYRSYGPIWWLKNRWVREVAKLYHKVACGWEFSSLNITIAQFVDSNISVFKINLLQHSRVNTTQTRLAGMPYITTRPVISQTLKKPF